MAELRGEGAQVTLLTMSDFMLLSSPMNIHQLITTRPCRGHCLSQSGEAHSFLLAASQPGSLHSEWERCSCSEFVMSMALEHSKCFATPISMGRMSVMCLSLKQDAESGLLGGITFKEGERAPRLALVSGSGVSSVISSSFTKSFFKDVFRNIAANYPVFPPVTSASQGRNTGTVCQDVSASHGLGFGEHWAHL